MTGPATDTITEPGGHPADGPGATKRAIEMVGVNKWFGDFHVLRDINLTVNEANASSSADRRVRANRRSSVASTGWKSIRKAASSSTGTN